jgi:hypothetical protein
MELTRMMVGPHGWVRFSTAEDNGPELYLRFRPSEQDGRWRIHEVYIDSTRLMSPKGLRQVPYAHCEEWANQEADALAAAWDIADAVGDNMSVLASYLGVTFNIEAHRDSSDWVALAYFSAFDAEVREGAELGHLRPPKKWKRAPSKEWRVSDQPDASFRLTVGPESRDLSDDFIHNVAQAYRAAVARGDRSPNVTIQQDLGFVDHRTVVRWVAEARRRGYLPPARKGATRA